MVAFGISIVGDTLANFRRYVRQADEMGVEMLGMGDSQSLYHEMWVRTTLAATDTSRARLGPWCTNPLTRHPAVCASALATIDELSGGRAFLGIAPGDSAVYNIGYHPARLDYLEAYIVAVRELLEGGVTTWRGREARLDWANKRIPIGIPASGPRALRLAGRLADIVWVCTGLDTDAIHEARTLLEEGAREAGRSLEDLEVWWVALLNVAASREVAIDQLKFSLASYAHIIFRFTMNGKAVPPDVAGPLAQLCASYSPLSHVAQGSSNPNAALVDRLGLTDYLADRLAIAGTVEDCARRIEEVRAYGIDRLWCPIRVADKAAVMDGLASLIAA